MIDLASGKESLKPPAVSTKKLAIKETGHGILLLSFSFPSLKPQAKSTSPIYYDALF